MTEKLTFIVTCDVCVLMLVRIGGQLVYMLDVITAFMGNKVYIWLHGDQQM